LEIVEWFDKDESRQMRYSPSTLQFVWLGRKLFGGRFIRFMSGPNHESDILTGSSTPNRCIDSLQKNHFDIDCLYHRQGNEQKQVAVHQI
jgi:hypothetical protein